MGIKEVVRPVAEEVAEPLGYEVLDVQFVREAGRYVLRIVADRPEGGFGLDDCERLSHAVEERLDVLDPIPHAYVLEVSSPGPERPLRGPADVERFRGERALLVTGEPDAQGRRRYTGELLGMEGEHVHLRLTDGQEVSIPWARVARAHLKPR